MSDILGRLYVEVTADTKKYDKNIDNAGKKSAELGKKLTSMSKVASIAIAGLAVASTKLASDLNESVNATNIVFGESNSIIQEWGKTASQQAGLSQAAFNESSALIGTLLKKTGQDMDNVALSTIEMTKRAADSASVFNKDLSVATTAFGAALRGETEPIRAFAIDVSAAAVEAEALSSGLISNKKELTEAIKVQARYNIIIRETENVSGDFTNTNNELANGTRVLKAELENAGAELGQAFLPIAKDVVSTARDMVQGFNALSDDTKKLIIGVAGVTGAIYPAIKAAGALKVAFTALSGPIGIALLAITGIVAAMAKFKEASLENEENIFGDIKRDTELTAKQINLINFEYADWVAQGKTVAETQALLQKEYGINNKQLTSILAINEFISDSEQQRYKNLDALNKRGAKLQAITKKTKEEEAELLRVNSAIAEEESQKRIDEVNALYQAQRDRVKAILDGGKTEVELIDEQIASISGLERAEGKLKDDQLAAIEILKAKKAEAIALEQQSGNEKFNALKSLEDEFTDKLLQQSEDRKGILEAAKQADIARAEALGGDVQQINDFYANEEIKLEEEIAEEKKAIREKTLNTLISNATQISNSILTIMDNQSNEELRIIQETLDAELEANNKSLNSEVEKNQKILNSTLETNAKILESDLDKLTAKTESEIALSEFLKASSEEQRLFDQQKTQEKIAELMATGELEKIEEATRLQLKLDNENTVRELEQTAHKDRLKREEEATTAKELAEKERLTLIATAEAKKIELEKETAAKNLVIQKEQAKKKYDIEVKQYKATKAISLAQTIVSTAQAIATSLTAAPFPFNLALAAGAGAAGLAQINAIESQPAPARPAFATGGVAIGATQALVGEERGEVMFGMGASGNPMFKEFIDRTVEGLTSSKGGGVIYNFNTTFGMQSPSQLRQMAQSITPYINEYNEGRS